MEFFSLWPISFILAYIGNVIHTGTTVLHAELEECVAKFVGKPSALVFGMGYVTNSAIIPVLIGKVFGAIK